MDTLIRYFDDIGNMAKVCYLTSNFMGHFTRTVLYLEFSSALKEFDGNKQPQISMHRPNVNLKFLNDIDCAKNHIANEQRELYNFYWHLWSACNTWRIQDWCRINRLEIEKDLKSSLSNAL